MVCIYLFSCCCCVHKADNRIFLAQGLVRVEMLSLLIAAFFFTCVLRRWLVCFLCGMHVCSAQDNAFEVVRLAQIVISVDLNEVL